MFLTGNFPMQDGSSSDFPFPLRRVFFSLDQNRTEMHFVVYLPFVAIIEATVQSSIKGKLITRIDTTRGKKGPKTSLHMNTL